MDGQMTYLETGSQNPYYNLAFEEFVLTERREGDYLLLWQNANTIVIGQNQNAEEEINRAFVEEHGIHVVRRSTGGGAVYHDLGNLNYSFLTDVSDSGTMSMARFTAPVVQALRDLGVQAEASGRNDILADGKKVSGTAQRLSRHRILHHGTLLFDSNPAMIAGALRADPEKFKSKSAKSVRSRIGNIRPLLAHDMTMAEFRAYLMEALAKNGLRCGSLTAAEKAAVETLKREKYDSWEWNFGSSPKYNLTNRRKLEGGVLEVRMEVEKGTIRHIVFYGDFLSRCALDEITAALALCPFREEAVAERLAPFALENYFGTISQRELLDTLFYVAD